MKPQPKPKPRKQFDDYASAAAPPGGDQSEQRNRWLCEAAGCICAGNISGICRFHWHRDAKQWPAMTQRLRDCEWLLKIVKFVRHESHDIDHGRISDRIAKAVQGRAPELAMQDRETLAQWANRADAWIEKGVSVQQRLEEREEEPCPL